MLLVAVILLLVLVVVIIPQFRLVRSVILRAVRGRGVGTGQRVQMRFLGVLDLWGLDGDSTVDDRDVHRSLPWAVLGLILVGSRGSRVLFMGRGVAMDVSRSVEGAGMLNFWGFHRDAIVDHGDVDGSVPFLKGSLVVVIIVGGCRSWLGVVGWFDLRGVSRDVLPGGGVERPFV